MHRNILLPALFMLSVHLAAAGKIQKQPQQGGGSAKPVSKEDKQKEELGAKINAAMQELKSMKLHPWPQTQSLDATGETGAYRVKTKDGKVQFLDALEKREHPEYEEIYVRASTGVMVNNGDSGWIPTYRWDPIYWSEKSKNWTIYPPAQTEFYEASSKGDLVIQLIGRFCDQKEFDKCGMGAGRLKYAGTAIKPEEKAKLMAEIESASRKAAAPWGGGEMLSNIFKTTVELESEKDPAKLVSLSMKRQKLLESAAKLIIKP